MAGAVATKSIKSLTLISLKQVQAQTDFGDDLAALRVWADGVKVDDRAHEFEDDGDETWTLGCNYQFYDVVGLALWELDAIKDDHIGSVASNLKGANKLEVTSPGPAKTVDIIGAGAKYRLTYELTVVKEVTAPPAPPAATKAQAKKQEIQFFADELMKERLRSAKAHLVTWAAGAKRCIWTGLVDKFGEAAVLARFIAEVEERLKDEKGFPVGVLHVNQRYLNVCALAATEVALILRNPKRFVSVMCEVFEGGRFWGTSRWIKARNGALELKYIDAKQAAVILKDKNSKVSAGSSDVALVDWMFALTLASWLTDFGSCTDVVGGSAGAVMQFEVDDLLNEVLLCRKTLYFGTTLTSSSVALETALAKLNSGSFQLAMLQLDAAMVKNKDPDEHHHSFVEWSSAAIPLSQLWVRVPPLSEASAVKSPLHEGYVATSDDPAKFSGSGGPISDWNHAVLLVPVRFVGAELWIDIAGRGLPPEVVMQDSVTSYPIQKMSNGKEVLVFCCITWGEIRWVAATPLEVQEWFGAVELAAF